MRVEMILLILGMGGVTYATRFICLFLVGKYTLPSLVARALPYIPIGILTAFVIPPLLLPGSGDMSGGHYEMLWGGMTSAVVAARWHHILWAMLAGMAVVLAFRHGIF